MEKSIASFVRSFCTPLNNIESSDDLNDSRHQRFIIELKSKQTLLIAHNIDLASRIEELALNDQVEFFGEYEWNAR